ncbi:hypothetical protein AB6C98_01755 [Vibrio splendidus]
MFKGCHFPSEVILETVRYYLAYKLSYREIEEIQLERGVVVGQATINRWVIKFTPVLEHRAKCRNKPVSGSWRMGETYIKVFALKNIASGALYLLINAINCCHLNLLTFIRVRNITQPYYDRKKYGKLKGDNTAKITNKYY